MSTAKEKDDLLHLAIIISLTAFVGHLGLILLLGGAKVNGSVNRFEPLKSVIRDNPHHWSTR